MNGAIASTVPKIPAALQRSQLLIVGLAPDLVVLNMPAIKAPKRYATHRTGSIPADASDQSTRVTSGRLHHGVGRHSRRV
jgi:hypothetical protein